MGWDDLRLLLAVSRAGGLSGAARELGVNHSTVFRRLAALEAELGTLLFERLPAGYRPTEAGARLALAAERMEAEALAADRDVTGRDTRLSGRLRVTASETLAFRLLPGELARFRQAQPGILVELLIDNRQLDLSRREADVALRATRPLQGDLWGRKLADMPWAVYAAPGLAPLRDIAGLADLPVIGWGETALPVKAAEWLAEAVPETAVVYRSSSLINQMRAALAGMGAAVLPCYLADAEPGLERLSDPVPELSRELWMITHQDLKATARVRAFMDLVGEGLRAALA
ncbi:MAG TPA: LysR family transcriptional regulator [Azospirillaceae bacterium]|nr:LysR family transcriptional regulator [Azospirillaceae bacterium]